MTGEFAPMALRNQIIEVQRLLVGMVHRPGSLERRCDRMSGPGHRLRSFECIPSDVVRAPVNATEVRLTGSAAEA